MPDPKKFSTRLQYGDQKKKKKKMLHELVMPKQFCMRLWCQKCGMWQCLWCSKMLHAFMMLKKWSIKYAVRMIRKLHKCIMPKMLPNESVHKGCKHIWCPKKVYDSQKSSTHLWMMATNSAHLCDAQKWAIKYAKKICCMHMMSKNAEWIHDAQKWAMKYV